MLNKPTERSKERDFMRQEAPRIKREREKEREEGEETDRSTCGSGE